MAVLSILASFLTLATTALGGIYPDNHWEHCTEVTSENADDFVKTNVDAGKTAPAWNKVTAMFKGNPDVAFGDVSLSKSRVSEIHGTSQNPGAGGWPTVRIFNNKTGYGGEAYTKKTSEAMCDELGPNTDYMQQLVEEYATLICTVDDTTGCSAKAKKFIEKWADEPLEGLKKQLLFLETAQEPSGGKAKRAKAKKWKEQRIDIFKQYARKHGEEL